MTRPLGAEPEEAKGVVERIAQGDLTVDIPVKAGDSTSLVAATSRMQANLRQITGQLKANAENVAAMAATVEEMTVSINHVSESAREAHSVTAETGNLSQAGNEVIEAMVAEMNSISSTVGDAAGNIRTMGENSQKISGIVQVIKDVAEQTATVTTEISAMIGGVRSAAQAAVGQLERLAAETRSAVACFRV